MCQKALFSEPQRLEKPPWSKQPLLSHTAAYASHQGGTRWSQTDLDRSCRNAIALALSQSKPGTLGTQSQPPGCRQHPAFFSGGLGYDWYPSLSCKYQDHCWALPGPASLWIIRSSTKPMSNCDSSPRGTASAQQKAPAQEACTDTQVQDSSFPSGSQTTAVEETSVSRHQRPVVLPQPCKGFSTWAQPSLLTARE